MNDQVQEKVSVKIDFDAEKMQNAFANMYADVQWEERQKEINAAMTYALVASPGEQSVPTRLWRWFVEYVFGLPHSVAKAVGVTYRSLDDCGLFAKILALVLTFASILLDTVSEALDAFSATVVVRLYHLERKQTALADLEQMRQNLLFFSHFDHAQGDVPEETRFPESGHLTSDAQAHADARARD